MKRAMLFSFLAAVLGSIPLYAQEWSPAQKDVLKTIENFEKACAGRNIGALESCLHPELYNWDYSDDRPIDRATFLKRVKESAQESRIVSFDYRPVAVRIIGDLAIVHAYYRAVEEDAKGQQTEINSRWMDVLVKKGGKWLMVGGHGGVLKK